MASDQRARCELSRVSSSRKLLTLSHPSHRIVNALIETAIERGCYKVILDCAEENVEFYKRAGMKKKEVQMVKYM